MTHDTLLEAEANETIMRWLAAVERLSLADYIPSEDFEKIPGQARADSYFWCDEFFTPEASPHRAAPDVKHGFHVATASTFDLLRHDYTVGELGVRVTESRSFTLVQLARPAAELLKLSPRDQSTEIMQIASTLLRMQGPRCSRSFTLRRKLAKGSSFCTNPSADPRLLGSWTERIDAGIRCGTLFFLCYKRVAQIVGFPNACQWFDDDFRSNWRP